MLETPLLIGCGKGEQCDGEQGMVDYLDLPSKFLLKPFSLA